MTVIITSRIDRIVVVRVEVLLIRRNIVLFSRVSDSSESCGEDEFHRDPWRAVFSLLITLVQLLIQI